MLTIPLHCRDTLMCPPCCSRTAESRTAYSGGAPPLTPGPCLSLDGAGRGSLSKARRWARGSACELNLDAIKATTAEHWERAGDAYLVHG